VVDSEDLPLNVGREILQKSKMLNVINKRLVRKSLDMFREIEKNETAYKTFWGNFGRYIKVRSPYFPILPFSHYPDDNARCCVPRRSA
jgi:HSP90 family molecular chaperone